MVTQNQTQVTEEQIQKDDARFTELNAKADKTEQENTELGELKTKYAGRAEKRIGQLTGEKKAAAAKAEEAERRAEEAEARLQELKDKQTTDAPPAVVGNADETVKIAEKQWFTDNALVAQIKVGKITEQAAIDYQRKRDREETVVQVKTDLKKEQETEALTTARNADADEVLKQHPEFGIKHPNHNSNDPLYIQWTELIRDGYGASPQGLTKALKTAKRILGIKNTHVDRSSELGVEDIASPADRSDKTQTKEVPFSTDEEDAAISMYTRGDVLNLATGRAYTRDEAIAKAKAAKQRRM